MRRLLNIGASTASIALRVARIIRAGVPMPVNSASRWGMFVDAAAWIAEFARRESEYFAWRDARHARIAAMIAAEHESHSSVVGVPVVLGIEEGGDDIPSSARRVVAGALAAGWSARVVASLAAVPTSGLVRIVTVRCRRRDERAWAAWRNGAFDEAWYIGPGGLERLGWARLGGRRISKHRGVLDVIEGVRGPKQWVDLLERQELDRAVSVLAQAFPGLSLTRQ